VVGAVRMPGASPHWAAGVEMPNGGEQIEDPLLTKQQKTTRGEVTAEKKI